MVDDAKKVSDEFSIAGQVTPEQLQQAAEEGFKSVLNLRTPNESGVLPEEQQCAEVAGLSYANAPLSNSDLNPDQVTLALSEIENLPKPLLIHCGAGLRAGGLALIAIATGEGLSLEEITQKAKELGVSLDQPHLKQFIQERFPNQT